MIRAGPKEISEESDFVRNECEPFRLYFTGFPFNFNEDNIRCLFEPYGRPDEIRIIRPPSGSIMAFLTMPSKNSACRAIEAMDGKTFGGSRLKVCKARPKTQKTTTLDDGSGKFVWRPTVVSTEVEEAAEQRETGAAESESGTVEDKFSSCQVVEHPDLDEAAEPSSVKDFLSSDAFERKRKDRHGCSRTIINKCLEPRIEMGLPTDDAVDVEVTLFESASCFWVKFMHQCDENFRLNEEMLNWYVHPGSEVNNVILNRQYLALVENAITRVQVIDKVDDEDNYRVLCVDLGYDSEVHVTSLRTMLSSHASLPAHAALVSFRNITDQDVELQSVNEFISSIMQTNYYRMKIKKYETASNSISSYHGFKIIPIDIVEPRLSALSVLMSASNGLSSSVDQGNLDANPVVESCPTASDLEAIRKSDEVGKSSSASVDADSGSEPAAQYPYLNNHDFVPVPDSSAMYNPKELSLSASGDTHKTVVAESTSDFGNSPSVERIVSANGIQSQSQGQCSLRTDLGSVKPISQYTGSLTYSDTASEHLIAHNNQFSCNSDHAQSTDCLLPRQITASTKPKPSNESNGLGASKCFSASRDNQFSTKKELKQKSTFQSKLPSENASTSFEAMPLETQASDVSIRTEPAHQSSDILLHNLKIIVDKSSGRRSVHVQCMLLSMKLSSCKPINESTMSNDCAPLELDGSLRTKSPARPGIGHWQLHFPRKPRPATRSTSTSPLAFNLFHEIDEATDSKYGESKVGATQTIAASIQRDVDVKNPDCQSSLRSDVVAARQSTVQNFDTNQKRSLPEQFLPQGRRIRVAIPKVDDILQSEFFVAILLSEEFGRATEAVKKFNSLDHSFIQAMLCRVYSPRIGDYYICVHQSTQTYQRVQLIRYRPTSGECEVLFVDFGVLQSTSVDSLYAIPNQLASIPPQAFACCLAESLECDSNVKAYESCYLVFTDNQPGSVIRRVKLKKADYARTRVKPRSALNQGR